MKQSQLDSFCQAEEYMDVRSQIRAYDHMSPRQNPHVVLSLLDAALLKDALPPIPPLHILLYALRSIFYPSFLPELMQDFLHLLAMVEFYRLSAAKDLTNDNADMRALFIKIVVDSCFIDLQRLWLAQSNTKFWSRFNEYLIPGSHTFHHNFTPHDLSALRVLKRQVTGFMEKTLRFAEDGLTKGQSVQESFNSQVFLKQHPSVSMSELSDILEFYLTNVEKAGTQAQPLLNNLGRLL